MLFYDMEPFGATTAALTVIKTLLGFADVVKSFKDAPNELLALNNEVSDLKLVISDIETLDRESNLVRNSSESLTKLLLEARIKVNALEGLAQELVNFSAESNVKIRRIKWVRTRSKVERLQRELREVRSNIAAVLAARSTEGYYAVQVVLDSVSLTSRTVKDEQTSHAHNAQSGSNNLQVLDGPPNAQQAVAPEDVIRQIGSFTSQILSSAGELQKLQRSLESQHMATPVPSETVRNEAKGKSPGPSGSQMAVHVERPSYTTVRVHKHQIRGCGFACGCACHKKHRLQSPDFLSQVVGKLFLGYSGRLVSETQCTNQACDRQTNFQVQATYVFPTWFVAKAMSLMAWKSQHSDLNVIVKIRTYAKDTEIFTRIEAGDISSIREMLRSRRCSPNHCESEAGHHPLIWAIDRGRTDICQLLLEAGADPTIEDHQGRSPIHLAYERSIGPLPRYASETVGKLRELFTLSDAASDLELPYLHQLVLGLVSGYLEDELKKPGIEINSQDRLGYTALTWAVQTNNNPAFRLLLEYKADPNIKDFGLEPPITHAILTKDPSTMRILLEAGACVQSDPDSTTPLYHAAYHHNDLTWAEPLIQAGCKPYPWDLYQAAIGDQDVMARYFINSEFDINRVFTFSGESCLVLAVRCGSDRVLRMLIEMGADYATVNKRGYTILHTAADYRAVTVETLEILTKLKMTRVDPMAKNSKGLTALDLLNRCHGLDDTFRAAFQRLIDPVTPPSDANHGPLPPPVPVMPGTFPVET